MVSSFSVAVHEKTLQIPKQSQFFYNILYFIIICFKWNIYFKWLDLYYLYYILNIGGCIKGKSDVFIDHQSILVGNAIDQQDLPSVILIWNISKHAQYLLMLSRFSHANKSAVVFQAFIQNLTMIGLNESESCFHNRCWKERRYVHVCVRIFVPELDLEGHRDPTLPSRHSHLALPLRPTQCIYQASIKHLINSILWDN